jgi:large repetitive protein
MKNFNVFLRVVALFLLVALIASAQSPDISFLDPGTVPSGHPTFTISVLGAGFAAGSPPLFGSIVRWAKGTEPEIQLPTVWVSSSEVIATVSASLVTAPGVVSVRVENRPLEGSSTFSNVVSFIVTEGVAITTPPMLPDGSQGVPYSTDLIAAGGTPPYTWRRLEGALPPGLTLDSDGTISGTPTTAGKYSAQIAVMDTTQTTDSRVFVIEILATPLTILTESPLPPAELSEFYNQALNASGGTPPYTWRRIAGTMPPGLTLFGDGIISGVPTSPGLFTFEVSVSDHVEDSLTKKYELLVIGPLEITTPSPLPEGTEGLVYELALEASGGVPAYLWSVSAGALPTGLTLGSDGVIRGTPTSSGSYVFTASVLDRRDDIASKPFTLLIGASVPPLAIATPPQLPDATAEEAYSTTLTATGGEAPYTWFLEEGDLPEGLMLDSASGVLSGTPTQTGDYSFQIAVSDAAEDSDSRGFRLRVGRPQLVITTVSPLPNGTVGQSYSTSFAATGGAPPYMWSRIEGDLPPGLTLSSSGVLAGTPTGDGTFTLAVRAADSEQDFVDKNFQITIGRGALSITTDPILPPGVVGQAYSTTVLAVGGIPPYTWTLIMGSLPPGVTLSASGDISGMPTEGGDFGFRLRVTDSTGGTTEQNFAIGVTAPPLPDISVDGLPEQTNPTDPQTLRASIAAPYPVDLTGTATLSFEPDATVPADDPAVQFSTGGRSVAFTIPAGITTARFGSGDTVGIATGSIAGVITTTTVIGSGDDAAQASQQMRVQRTAPSITAVTATRVAGGFEVRVTGFSSPRDMTSARFQFRAGAGTNLQTTEATVQVADVFGGWYQNDESDQFGSTFLYTQPFTIQGDANAVNGVTVTLTNSTGTSEAATANF